MTQSHVKNLFNICVTNLRLIFLFSCASFMAACATPPRNEVPIAARGLTRIDTLTKVQFHEALISSMWNQTNDRNRLELVRALYGDLDAEYSARVQAGIATSNAARDVLQKAQQRLAPVLQEFPGHRYWVSKTIHGQLNPYDVQPSNTFVAKETLYPNDELEYITKRTSRFDKALEERRLRVALAGMNPGPKHVYGPLGPDDSHLNVSFDPPTITLNIPVEKADYQDAVYQAVKRRETLRYTLIADVEFDLSHCNSTICELRVSDTQVRNFQFSWSDQ